MRKLNILYCSVHDRGTKEIAKTGHNLFCMGHAGEPDTYPYNHNGKLNNIFIYDPGMMVKYDLALVSLYPDASIVKSKYPELPIVFVCWHYIESYNRIIQDPENFSDGYIFFSERNGIKCNHPNKHIIHYGFDVNEYYNYTGDIDFLMTVCHRVAKRKDDLIDKEFMDEIVCDLNHSYFGEDNQYFKNSFGFIDFDVLKRFYQHYRAKIFCPTSLREEIVVSGPCLSVHEAIASGMPVIITEFADWPEFIKNEVNGFISNDKEQLRYYCIDLIKNKELALKIGARGRVIIENILNLENWKRQWDNVLSKYAG